jgi:hypothetical protein
VRKVDLKTRQLHSHLVFGFCVSALLAGPRTLWGQTDAEPGPGTRVIGAPDAVATGSTPPAPAAGAMQTSAASTTQVKAPPPTAAPTSVAPAVGTSQTVAWQAPDPANPPTAPNGITPQSPALSPGWSWVDTVASNTEASKEAPKRNPFRGSRFDWTHNVTTSTLGIGQDYQSSSYQVYQQGFSLLLAYFPYDGERARVRLAMAPGLDLALTNSDITTSEREPLFRDLPVVVGASFILAMDPDNFNSTIVAPNLAFFLPTSKMSWNSGDYLTVSPRISLSQQLPLFGAGAMILDDIDVWLQLRYDHLFSRGATPIDTGLDRASRGLQGGTTQSDVLDGSQNAPNAFRVDLSLAFSEQLFERPLTVTINADYRMAQLYGVAPYEVQTATGPVVVEPDPNARTWRRGIGFGADATYQLMPSMSVAMGYAACGNELCPARGADLGNSTYDTPFYTPHAIFWAGLVVHVDTVLDAIINGDKTNSSVLRRDLAITRPPVRF